MASLPLLGSFDIGFNMGFGLIVVGALMVLGGFALGRAFVNKLPLVGKWLTRGGPALGVVVLLVASFVNVGGLLHMDGATGSVGIPGATAMAPAVSTGAFDASRYETTSKVTFTVADAADKSAQNAAIKVYKSGVTEKAFMEGSATPEYTATASSGSATIDAIQVQTLGCKVDVGLDLSGYYQKLIRDVNICREKNLNGVNTVSPPTFYIEDAGTLSLGLTPTSLTCSAGSQCTYSLIIRNSESDAYNHRLAAKFTNVANATLDSVEAGAPCEIVDVSGTQYVKFTGDLASLGTATCNVKVTRASGSADGSWTWTLDDNFQYLGSTAWNTQSSIRGATATGATTVSFA